MRILYGKVFGIGNAVMAIPAIKALQQMGHEVDILVGNLPDDYGAYQILSKVVRHPNKIYVSEALERDYDVAIMAIPYDGRWINGVHFRASSVYDRRTRPDPSTTGLVSWKKHESEYQMDNVRELGFEGEDPKSTFILAKYLDPDKIYLGIGYKKDKAGFWKVKHWGNENYAELISKILEKYPTKKVITTGDAADLQLTIAPISRIVSNSRFEFKLSANLDEAFNTMLGCSLYIGNDTGMMHVAASIGMDVIAMFFLENSVVKSSPLAVNPLQKVHVLDGSKNREWITSDVIMSIIEAMNG